MNQNKNETATTANTNTVTPRALANIRNRSGSGGPMGKRVGRMASIVLLTMSSLCIPALSPSAEASVAWGSINNFDTVNDTGVSCHGFEIEIDGIHSRDISYTNGA